MRSVLTILLLLAVPALPAEAQEGELSASELPGPPPDRRALQLRELELGLSALDTDAADNELYAGSIALAAAVGMTLIGGLLELFVQELGGGGWREPSWAFYATGGAAMLLSAIAIPLIVSGATDGAHIREGEIHRRRRELLQPATTRLEVRPAIGPERIAVMVSGRF